MPRMPKKTDNRGANETTPRQFRLKTETLDDLDLIAQHLTEETGIAHSRTDALRYAARQVAKGIQKKLGRPPSR